jgi:hypothetical protein
MGIDPQERLAKSYKTGDMKKGIWCKLMKLHTVHIKKPMKKLVGRKRKTAQKESKEHHPEAAFGLGDSLDTREDD